MVRLPEGRRKKEGEQKGRTEGKGEKTQSSVTVALFVILVKFSCLF